MNDTQTHLSRLADAFADEATAPRYPHIVVQLTGRDGNAFMILGLAQRAMLRDGVPREAVQSYVAEATAGDYDHLLATTMAWVTVK